MMSGRVVSFSAAVAGSEQNTDVWRTVVGQALLDYMYRSKSLRHDVADYLVAKGGSRTCLAEFNASE